MNHDGIHVGHDEKRRVFQGTSVLLKLRIRCREIFMLPFVLPAEATTLPDIRESVTAGSSSRRQRSMKCCCEP